MAHGSQVPTPCAVCTCWQCLRTHVLAIQLIGMAFMPIRWKSPSNVWMSAACTSLREWLRAAALHAVRLLHARLCDVHVLPPALQARGAQRDRD